MIFRIRLGFAAKEVHAAEDYFLGCDGAGLVVFLWCSTVYLFCCFSAAVKQNASTAPILSSHMPYDLFVLWRTLSDNNLKEEIIWKPERICHWKGKKYKPHGKNLAVKNRSAKL